VEEVMRRGIRKATVKDSTQPNSDFKHSLVVKSSGSRTGIDPDVLREFGISLSESAGISSRSELIQVLASKVLASKLEEPQGEGLDARVLSAIELMIDTDPELREFVDSCFEG